MCDIHFYYFQAKREGKELRDSLFKAKNYDPSKEIPSSAEEAKL